MNYLAVASTLMYFGKAGVGMTILSSTAKNHWLMQSAELPEVLKIFQSIVCDTCAKWQKAKIIARIDRDRFPQAIRDPKTSTAAMDAPSSSSDDDNAEEDAIRVLRHKRSLPFVVVLIIRVLFERRSERRDKSQEEEKDH